MPNSDSPPEKHNEGRGEFGFGLQMPRFRPKKTKTSVKGEKLSMPNSDSPPEKHNEGRGEFGFGFQMPRFRPKKTKTSVKGELSEKEKSDFVLSHNDPPLSNFDVVKENDNSAIDQIEKQEGQSVKHECTKQEKKKHGFGFKFPKFGFPSFAPPSANHSAVPENGACAAERRPKKNKGGGGFGLKMPKFS